MANRIYRYKRLATTHEGKRIKAWCKPVFLIRKVGDITCEGCFFDRCIVPGLRLCTLMNKNKKNRQELPPCSSKSSNKSYIFVKKFIKNERKHEISPN